MKKLQLNKTSIATLSQNFEKLKNAQNIIGGDETLVVPKITEQPACKSDLKSVCAHCCDNV